MKMRYCPAWPGMGASADSSDEESGGVGGPVPLDLRLVSVEYHEEPAARRAGGEQGVATASAGGAKKRILWPCLYFRSAEDMVHSLVTYEWITPADAKAVRNHCAALRLSRLAQRRPPGASVAYLLGRDRNSLPGAAERERIGVGTPVVLPDDEPVDFIAHYAEAEDASEGAGQVLWDAFCGAVDEWSDIQDAAEASGAGTGGRLSLASFRRSPAKKRKAAAFLSLDAASMLPHESKTPRPEPKAPPAAMVTDTRPSAAAAAAGANANAPSRAGISIPEPLKEHVYTPALTDGAQSGRGDVLIPDAGSSITSPCAVSGPTSRAQLSTTGTEGNPFDPSVPAPAGNAAGTSVSDQTPGTSPKETVHPPASEASVNALPGNHDFPTAGDDDGEAVEDRGEGSLRGSVDKVNTSQPAALLSGSESWALTRESPPKATTQIGPVEESCVASDPASGPAGVAFADDHPHASSAHSAGIDAGDATSNVCDDPGVSAGDNGRATVPASSSAGTVVSSDGSTFESPSRTPCPSARATASATRTSRPSSARKKKRSEGQEAKKSPSKHREPEMDRLGPIPTSLTIQRLLQKAGFSFDDGNFTRPTGESFKSEEDLRRDLCGYGLDDCDCWSEKERKQVSDWVRYTHVKVGSSRDFQLLTPREFILYGERLGMKYHDAYYVLPNGHGVDTEVELQEHLCRFGLPRECSADALNETELLSFSMYFAQTEHYNPFERKSRIVHPSGKKLRPRPSLDSSVGEYSNIHLSPCHPIASKGSAKRTVRSIATESVPRPRRDVEFSVSAVGPSSPCFPLSPLARASASPTVARTCREQLIACKDLPTASSRIVYPSNSSFEDCAKKVESFVRCVIDSEASHGSSDAMPACLYVCGAPGLGKTAAVRACCESLARGPYEDLPRPIVCYVNASTMDASPQPDAVLLQRVADTLEMRYSRLPQINSIKGYMTKKHVQVLLIIDEIDILLSNKEDASAAVTSKQEGALEMLAAWAGDPNLPIGVIGISNRKGNTKYERLKQLLKFAEVVDFKPYSQSDIIHIVEALVGPSVIDKPGLQLIGAKTEQNRGGDIRYAFEVVSKAAHLCLEAMSETELNATPAPGTPLIKMGSVHKVFQAENAHIRVAINDLPATGKALLVILSTLAEENVQCATVKMLKNFSGSVGINAKEAISAENFVFMLSTLCDNGLLDVGGKSLHSLTWKDVSEVQVKLGLCLDEVTAVVNDELCNYRVFAEVRDRVRVHRRTFNEENQRDALGRGRRGK